MRIACPTCGAAYDVPPDRVPPGREVRCARCGGMWTPVAVIDASPAIERTPDPVSIVPDPPAIASAESVSFDDPSPMPDAVEPPAVTAAHRLRPSAAVPNRRVLLAAWIVSALVLLGLLWLLMARRDGVMQAWPPSERLFNLLGLHR